ncbi:serpin (serine protease inhibitor) domain-containing protein [Ditylenchus destructor]|uniref:Serpin (Serine protease inhibitor) domain-containing protein n=1 Tax=Ditylenchus destructor TaxID=166010 RepID=A0AAD4MU24_9BILA|nr:serpin (serine protease inhibitor) domain-containing protein [Ditylenchus destructor]
MPKLCGCIRKPDGARNADAEVYLNCYEAAKEISENSVRESSYYFAADLMKTLRKNRNSEKNMFFSPISAAILLVVLLAGANDETAQQIVQALFEKRTDDEKNEPGSVTSEGRIEKYFSYLAQGFKKLSEYGLLYAANKIYVPKSEDSAPRLNQDYTEKINKLYNCTLESENFNEPEKLMQKINDLVAELTHGQIPEAVSLDDVMDPNTKPQKFYFSDGTEKDVEMMYQHISYSTAEYAKNNEVEVIYLEYEPPESLVLDTDAWKDPLKTIAKPMAICVILPRERYGLNTLMENMDGPQLVKWMQLSKRRANLNIRLPKFKIENRNDLIPPLQQLGLREMFTNNADFTRAGLKNMKVTNAFQQAVLEIDEEGSTASAYTMMRMRMCGLYGDTPPTPTVDFTADHAFAYIILTGNGDCLFMGTYGESDT